MPYRAIILALLAATGARAEETGCFALPEADRPAHVDHLSIDTQGRILLTFTGAPHAVADFDCALDAEGKAHCSVDCDGGNLYLDHRGDEMLARFEGLRFESVMLESMTAVTPAFDADGVQVYGNFRLKPAPAAACQVEGLLVPVDLRPGDYAVQVADLEGYLARGGYFAEVPDWYYTRETAEAVQLFQRELGLEETGRADRGLIRKIGIQTDYVLGGGC